MDVFSDALLVFYGIFWASTIGAATRFRAFETAAFFAKEKERRKRAINRFLCASLIMDIFPIYICCIKF